MTERAQRREPSPRFLYLGSLRREHCVSAKSNEAKVLERYSLIHLLPALLMFNLGLAIDLARLWTLWECDLPVVAMRVSSESQQSSAQTQEVRATYQ